MFGKYRRLYKESLEKQLDNENQIYNLNLYLYWLEQNFADIYEDMQTYFEGMAGYAGDKLIKIDELPDDFVFNK